MRTVLLIDGDEYLFKACAAVERETRWDEWNHVLHCNRGEAWDNFTRMVDQLGDRLGADDRVLCFSGRRPYFREELYPDYKAGRQGRKPLCYTDLREQCDAEYAVRTFDGLEADDVMGILATKNHPDIATGRSSTKYIICSQDKDMLTVPGWLWRQGEVQVVTRVEADKYFLSQALKGDPTDGYKGCPGMGDKRAAAWLSADKGAGVPWSWARVVSAYERAGLSESDALLQARLARILRWADWDSKEKKVKLWEPAKRPNEDGTASAMATNTCAPTGKRTRTPAATAEEPCPAASSAPPSGE